ncbi:spore germination protein [Paenibacillus sp.]|uniref:spore germination protein n=1 Tax=Paenibacillus sp. TaxID=58172 RepID=UPI0028121E08|nr:spore germination protein [Paenibacillus sp.]
MDATLEAPSPEQAEASKVQTEFDDLELLIEQAKRSTDYQEMRIPSAADEITVSYYGTLVDKELLRKRLIEPLQRHASQSDDIHSLEGLARWIPTEEIEVTDQVEIIQSKLLRGHALVRRAGERKRCALVPLAGLHGMRKDNTTENEFSVVGPNVGFIEDLDTNLHLLRMQLSIPQLVVKELTIGSMSKSRVAIVYIEGVTNERNVQTARQRLEGIDFDVIFDTSLLDQMIADESATPFPLFVTTERRDRVVYALISGQVAIIADGSPYFITGPSTLHDFFISPEDYFLPWILGSFFRIIRIIGVVFSLFATSFYIAITTFHYEVIPQDLLGPLIYSRMNVPFPPVFEVLFLELTIEFLREAGARLPTKIGQTLGIVGGIIIGQAAVEAALTSNILIIVVALSALASFTTPIYKMSNTIRFLRFPMIVLSSLWGAIGLFIGIGFLLVHVTKLTSLGSPYTVPVYPLRVGDLNDSLIRPPFPWTSKRPGYLRPRSRTRYTPGAGTGEDADED